MKVTMLVRKKLQGQSGLANLLVIIGLAILSVALPAATSLVQQSQETRKQAAELTCPVNDYCCPQPLISCTANDQCPNGYRWCYAGVCINDRYNPPTNTCTVAVPTSPPGISCPVNAACCFSPLMACAANTECPSGYRWCYAGVCINDRYNSQTNTCPGSVVATPTPTPPVAGGCEFANQAACNFACANDSGQSCQFRSGCWACPAPQPTVTPTPTPVAINCASYCNRLGYTNGSCTDQRSLLPNYYCGNPEGGGNLFCLKDREIVSNTNCDSRGLTCLCQSRWSCQAGVPVVCLSCCSPEPTPTPERVSMVVQGRVIVNNPGNIPLESYGNVEVSSAVDHSMSGTSFPLNDPVFSLRLQNSVAGETVHLVACVKTIRFGGTDICSSGGQITVVPNTTHSGVTFQINVPADTGLVCPVNFACCPQPLKMCSCASYPCAACPAGYQWCYAGICISDHYNSQTGNCLPPAIATPTPAPGAFSVIVEGTVTVSNPGNVPLANRGRVLASVPGTNITADATFAAYNSAPAGFSLTLNNLVEFQGVSIKPCVYTVAGAEICQDPSGFNASSTSPHVSLILYIGIPMPTVSPTPACLGQGSYCGPLSGNECCSDSECKFFTCQYRPATPTPPVVVPTTTPPAATPTSIYACEFSTRQICQGACNDSCALSNGCWVCARQTPPLIQSVINFFTSLFGLH